MRVWQFDLWDSQGGESSPTQNIARRNNPRSQTSPPGQRVLTVLWMFWACTVINNSAQEVTHPCYLQRTGVVTRGLFFFKGVFLLLPCRALRLCLPKKSHSLALLSTTQGLLSQVFFLAA